MREIRYKIHTLGRGRDSSVATEYVLNGMPSSIYEGDPDKKLASTHIEDIVQPAAYEGNNKSYAEDGAHRPVTVAGTMGQDPEQRPDIRWTAWAILFLCAMAQFQNTFFGIAPAANAYPIAGALNGMDKRIWIVQAQGIPSIVTGPIISIFSDLYGRKWIVLGAWGLFCISSIVAMTAQSINVLIFAQTLSGCAAGISGIMFATASEVLPSKYRSHAQTAVNCLAGLSSIPALLGMAAATGNDPVNGWRWIFRTQLVLSAIVFIGFALIYRPPPRTVEYVPIKERFRRLDWIGYLFLMGGLVPMLMGFAWASDRNYGWKDPHAYGCVAAGSASFIICLIYEWKGTETGFLHHSLFQDGRNFPIAIFVIAVEGSLFYLINNIYPSQVFTIWVPAGGVKAGAHLLPFFMVCTAISPLMSLYVTRRSDIKWPICAGFIFFSVSVIGFAMSGTNVKLGLVFNALAGVGFVAPLVLVMTMVQLSTPPLFIGVASALTISARTLGGTVGYAIAEVIYNNISDDKIPGYIASAVIPLGFNPSNLGSLIGALLSHGSTSSIPGITPRILGAAMGGMASAQAYAFRITWFAFLPATVIAAAAAACFRNPKDRMNWIVDAPLEAKHADQSTEGKL
ncbi:major facilitator superfamily domain-containing protein [Filobasidium floriforme]|uniref:major facilitator superfamily domain-containing protein n=1 Tax=Filobasidium floriforme TaxID=5210 RepID=UPI001E8D2A9B|nr:major facilitator superfamily domain-containing protein [Filobasidium floriforme]KAH8083141.1 major facilitator superfamily domain-containing protein [Filobasidium floriforme]